MNFGEESVCVGRFFDSGTRPHTTVRIGNNGLILIYGFGEGLFGNGFEREIGLFGFVCGLFDYPPNGDNVSSIVDIVGGIFVNGFNGNECEFGAVFTAIQQLERE